MTSKVNISTVPHSMHHPPEGSTRWPTSGFQSDASASMLAQNWLEEKGSSVPLWVGSGRKGATHHLQDVGGDHLHAAHGRGQCTHNGGEDVEGTHAEEQILREKKWEKVSSTWQHRQQTPLPSVRVQDESGRLPSTSRSFVLCMWFYFMIKIGLSYT